MKHPMAMCVVKEMHPKNAKDRWEPPEWQLVTNRRRDGKLSGQIASKGIMLLLEAILYGPQTGIQAANQRRPTGGQMVGVQVKPNLEKCFALAEDVEITVKDRENRKGDSVEMSMQILEVNDPEDMGLHGPKFLRVAVNTISVKPKKGEKAEKWTLGRRDDLWAPVVEHHMHIARAIAGLKCWDIDLNIIWAANKPKLEIQDMGCAPPKDTHYLDLLRDFPVPKMLNAKLARHDPTANPPGTRGHSESCTLGCLPRRPVTANKDDDGAARRV